MLASAAQLQSVGEGRPAVTQLSRRTLLAAGVTTLSTAGLLARSAPAGVSPSPSVRPAPSAVPLRSLFSGAIGALFTAAPLTASGAFAGGVGIRLRLEEILDLVPASVPDDDHRFALIFRSTHPRFAEGIFSLHRDGVATTTLFLSPVDKVNHAGSHSIQAVINRLA
jgi:hypothetical protein